MKNKRESDLKVGAAYVIGSNQAVFLYTGMIQNPNEKIKKYEFLFLPRYMNRPPKKPTTYQTRLFEEGIVVTSCGQLSNNKYRTVFHQPGTPDHRRLTELLTENPEPLTPLELEESVINK